MATEFTGNVTRKITDFLKEIGLEVESTLLDDKTFLPGVLVDNGRIMIDESKLKYPGDLLHEAGHLALAAPELRSTLSGEVRFPGVVMEPVEAQAIAWSYAAALHLGLDPAIVFHDGGYRGNSQSLLFNFSVGVYIGVSGLEQAGLTCTPKQAAAEGVPPYPGMTKWVRD